jgi:hypothetical protein
MSTFKKVVVTLALAVLITSSTALATDPEEQNQDPGWECTLVCWAGLDGTFGCQCGGGSGGSGGSGGGGGTTCQQGCSDGLYSRMASCASVDPSDPEYQQCIDTAYDLYDDCVAAC